MTGILGGHAKIAGMAGSAYAGMGIRAPVSILRFLGHWPRGRVADQSYIAAHSDSLAVRFIDNDLGNWVYYDIVEATNSHSFERVDGKEVWTGVSPTA